MSTQAPPRRQRRIPVYNPTHLSDEVQAFGHFYRFPPRGIGRCNCAEHNKPGAEDNEGCHAVLDYSRDEKTNHLLTALPKKVGADGELTADRVAEFIVSDACRGAKQFVILSGTDKEIAAQKRGAEERYVAFHLEEVAASIEAWETHVAQVKMTNPGAMAPKMPKSVVEDYAFRRRHKEAVALRAEFVCATCGYETDVSKEYTDHVRDEHPNVAAREQPPLAGSPPEATATVPPKEKAPAGSGKKLLARAEAVGIHLTVADRKGLEHDDVDVIEDIERSIADQKEAAKKARRQGVAAPA